MRCDRCEWKNNAQLHKQTNCTLTGSICEPAIVHDYFMIKKKHILFRPRHQPISHVVIITRDLIVFVSNGTSGCGFL